jgi:hypothetical protein
MKNGPSIAARQRLTLKLPPLERGATDEWIRRPDDHKVSVADVLDDVEGEFFFHVRR